ncbi:TonB-dependent receptor [Pseudomonas fluorescens]|uniref:TonB-dependent receptor plug domain-containing protein n=1 Tax=Pseudomonas TaxID=286 RepID=UPI000EA8934B|nr:MULTISPECIES: TonB-dependent receptor [Pseudomonas]AYG07506.1 TonB-dependent receptor [Pseudomonas fluorescens]MBK3438963.1 TonB-dependent receptor [Pseudomonas sp. MF7448]MBK3454759.1 TonB-dependent receptor [Pseudomonas sp. MF6754]NMX33845.1 TonB-dependent receptor [Pseudomonas sp. WS 5413]QXH91374.1 TonB-dependent receptor [Pseudomonas shahriarae]
MIFQRSSTSGPTLLLGCLFSPLLLADDTALVLNQQIVSAPSVESTTVADMAQYGSKVEIVSREQIERAGPSADITRAMQMFIPGFYVAPKNGPFDYGTYSLLGGRNDDTLILLDGVRLNNRLYGGLYLDTLPANAVERIEVLKGGQSLLFGTQAVAGVINIVTRSPQTRDVSGETNLGVDTFGGTTGDARAERIFTNGLGDLGLLAYVSHNVSEGYQPFRNRDMSNVSDKKRSYEVTTFGAKAIQSLGDDSRLELFYQYSDANLDFAGATNNRKTTNDRVQQIATATFEQRLNERLSYFVKGHINDWDTRYSRVNNTADGGTVVRNRDDYWGFTDWGVQAEGKAELEGGHVLVFGSDNQWFKGQDDVLIIDNNKAEAHALYSQLRPQIDALPDWHPSIGLRHETMSGGDSATVGMLTSLYDLNANWALRGQYGSAYKLPNAEQLFVNEPGDEIGNRNLKPEKSRNAELGLDYKGLLADREFSASVTLFKRKITDLITLDDSHWVNGQGQIQVRGFEADAKLALNQQWSLQADMTRNLTESRAGVTLNDVPSFFARSRVGFESQNRLWGAGAAIRYIHDVISSKRVEYGHYSVVDADAYRYLDNAHQHRVSLLVENLFDRDYVTSRSSNVDNLGRPFTTEVRYTYRF